MLETQQIGFQPCSYTSVFPALQDVGCQTFQLVLAVPVGTRMQSSTLKGSLLVMAFSALRLASAGNQQ